MLDKETITDASEKLGAPCENLYLVYDFEKDPLGVGLHNSKIKKACQERLNLLFSKEK